MGAKKFGLIGHPLGHSLSAVMYNAAFKALRLNCNYEDLDILPSELNDFMRKRAGEFSGLNVTIPCKRMIMDYLDCADEISSKIGAANTIKIGDKIAGFNTDCFGFEFMLNNNYFSVSDKKILVIGAGGAARAVIYALLRKRDYIYVSNRSPARAFELMRHFDITPKNGAYVEQTSEFLSRVMPSIDIIVNTTPVGMHPNVNESPISASLLSRKHDVVDIIYNPLETKLLKEAKTAGCRTLNGIDMLVYQGAESLRLWLGIEPPVDLMRKEVVKHLAV